MKKANQGLKRKGVQLANISRTLPSMALTVGGHYLSLNQKGMREREAEREREGRQGNCVHLTWQPIVASANCCNWRRTNSHTAGGIDKISIANMKIEN